MVTTRFAPSPNGSLHLGHAYSAVIAHDLAMSAGGRFLLRIEDIDGPRSRPEYADDFRRDLEWLGLTFTEVAAQSTRLDTYADAFATLRRAGLVYPCICTRAQVAADAVAEGPDGPIYAGTCKGRSLPDGEPAAWRLDMGKALAQAGDGLTWEDAAAGVVRADPAQFGDVVLVRKDLPASYHLAATLDDAADGVTLVTRGADLMRASHIHRLLQSLLGLPVPRWHHHGLLVDESGTKLAKRRGSAALAQRRADGENGRALADRLRNHDFPAGITLSPSLSGNP